MGKKCYKWALLEWPPDHRRTNMGPLVQHLDALRDHHKNTHRAPVGTLGPLMDQPTGDLEITFYIQLSPSLWVQLSGTSAPSVNLKCQLLIFILARPLLCWMKHARIGCRKLGPTLDLLFLCKIEYLCLERLSRDSLYSKTPQCVCQFLIFDVDC